MLEPLPHDHRVSTGLPALDVALGGLFWGDNVAWQLDRVGPEPFFRAITRRPGVFASMTSVAFTTTYRDVPGMTVVDARRRRPADLLREIGRLTHPRAHRLVLFDSLDAMVSAWGVARARDFFARCCPLLLERGAIGFWPMSAGLTAAVQETVLAVAQCVLRVDARSVRIAKAEGRDHAVSGTVLHWHQEAGRPVLARAELAGRVAASLRTVRRVHGLSQHDLGDLAGVSASAISQAERAERGLSLATLVRLSGALGVTIDELLRGSEPGAYRVGRRGDDPLDGFEHIVPLLGGPELSIDLVHLGPREASAPVAARRGTAIVAVATGLVQVQVAGQTPVVRHGEVLVTDSEQVTGWRNLGNAEAELFWIVRR